MLRNLVLEPREEPLQACLVLLHYQDYLVLSLQRADVDAWIEVAIEVVAGQPGPVLFWVALSDSCGKRDVLVAKVALKAPLRLKAQCVVETGKHDDDFVAACRKPWLSGRRSYWSSRSAHGPRPGRAP